MLDNVKLQQLLTNLDLFIREKVYLLNRTGDLENFLEMIGFQTPDEKSNVDWFFNPNKAKVLVIGFTDLKLNDLQMTARKMGILSEQIEFISGEAIKQFNYAKLRFNSNYSDVIFGPIHHNGKGIGEVNSPIRLMESSPGGVSSRNSCDGKFKTKDFKREFQKGIRKYTII